MSMIAEFEHHYGTIAMFPIRNDIWRNNAIHMQKYVIDLVNIISRFEPVLFFCKTEYIDKLSGLANNIQVVECDYDDIWARDIGPTFIKTQNGIEAVDWKFNAWGGKKEGSYFPWDADDKFASFVSWYLGIPNHRIDNVILEGGGIASDGENNIYITRSVTLNRNRNPFKKAEYIEHIIKDALHAKEIVWIPQGLAMDETNGHIDNLLAFISPNTVCLAWTDDKKDPNYKRVRAALNALESRSNLNIYKIPLPPKQYMSDTESIGLETRSSSLLREEGDLLPASYLNFYMVNGGVIIPAFGCDTDIIVKKLFQQMFPNREVVQIYSREPLLGGGGIHCILHEIPDIKNSTGIVKSVLSPKVEIRTGGIDKTGMFAKEDIEPGEIVFIKGGHVLKRNELVSSSVINSYMPISDDYCIGAKTIEEEKNIKLYNNHSCNPNCGLRGKLTFVAIKHIKADEELTVDYAFIDNEEYEFTCNCGSHNCRHTITGYDWKRKDIQDLYYPYFSDYIKKKIDSIRNPNSII